MGFFFGAIAIATGIGIATGIAIAMPLAFAVGERGALLDASWRRRPIRVFAFVS